MSDSLYDAVKISDCVVGKTTGVVYKVIDKHLHKSDAEDSIFLTRYETKYQPQVLPYSKLQFDYHFKKR